jgi:hypothetical protein
LSGALGTLALVWAVAALVEWYRRRFTLMERAFRVANRVRRCAPRWWQNTDYGRVSAYGTDVDMVQHLRRLTRNADSWRQKLPHRLRRYSPRLHERVTFLIEEMARSGVQDYRLRPYLLHIATPQECEYLARDLWWAANKLPE